jgi:ubiquinone/menaquinone biosynthesis C-methylase UbiE
MRFEINIKQLKNEGYCHTSVLGPHDVNALLLALMEVKEFYFDCRSGFVSTTSIIDAGHRRFVDERIRSIVESPIEAILPGYNILFSNFLVKNPGLNGSVGIHSDWSYVNESEHTSYNLWIPLVDVDEGNGCMCIWPQSHQYTPKVRFTPYEPYSFHEEQTVLLHSQSVKVCAGQGILYHSGLIHFSNPNYSPVARPAVAMVLVPRGSQPVHYFRGTEDTVSVFHVNREFFLNHEPGQAPIGLEPEMVLPHQSYSLFEAIRKHVGNFSQVGLYYDIWTDGYEDVYGDVIQAFRPESEMELMEYIINSAQIVDGQELVDAGCGTCGPAIHIAKCADVVVDAITASRVQVLKGNEKIIRNSVEDRVSCRRADFSIMEGVAECSKDGVLFLESLGHCTSPTTAIDSSYYVLKDQGFIYIKDFFCRESANAETAQRIRKSVEKINAAYNYNVLNLSNLLVVLSKAGFVIDFVRRFGFDSDTRVRKEFETRFEISVFHDGEFELAEWLEIRAIKHFTVNER